MTFASDFADFATSGFDFGIVAASILDLTDASSLDLIADEASDFAFGVKAASIRDLRDNSDDFGFAEVCVSVLILAGVSVIDAAGVSVDVSVIIGLGCETRVVDEATDDVKTFVESCFSSVFSLSGKSPQMDPEI